MGTSSVHRSPSTARWRFVQSMYEDEGADPSRLLSEILNAASTYVDGLSDRAVRTRLETLIATDRRRLASSDDVIQAAADLVREAQHAGRASGAVSFYGDLADRALFASVARSASDQASLASDAAVVKTFTRELIGFAVDHLVSRDVTLHLGERSMPTATAMLSLRAELVTAARGLVDAPPVAERAQMVAESPRQRWRGMVSSAWAAGRSIPDLE